MADLHELDAQALSRAYASGEASPAERQAMTVSS